MIVYTLIMQIDGKEIARGILARLSKDITALRVAPTLAVIQVGDNPASLAYIRQKQKAAEKIGARMIVSNTIADVWRFNTDPSVHGIIVQRPVPEGTPPYAVTLQKDVDGFEPGSPFDVPVVAAVGEILQTIHPDDFQAWVQQKTVTVIGRGSTAGNPIFHYFQKLHCATSQIHSQTPDPEKITKDADIIVSCVGKRRVLTGEHIKPGVILIGVGLWRDSEGKLKGDYEEPEIANIASAFTPTPGGVGPVNVACLMQNLVKACTLQQGGGV